MMKKSYYILILISVQVLYAQDSKNVLFLGNSYTASNNLPNLVQQVATSVGDTFTYDTNTPGGHTLQGHSTNTISLNKIKVGNWDYVVLQEQSQRPSFPDAQVANDVYPYAQRLNDSIVKYNPCVKTTFYMTWGRENGDAGNCGGWPPVCTYEGMDDLLRQRYQIMANDNDAIASPVGAVWRYLRENHPTLDLYSGDGSHPSLTGSYAAAITFYTTLYRKDPTLITFNSTLSTTDANNIKDAVKLVVFDDFSEWNIGSYDPVANFTVNATGFNHDFTNTSNYSISYLWDFGDGNTSTEENPSHTYTINGNYTVTLTITNCGETAISTQNINVSVANIEDEVINNQFIIVKNPINNQLLINSSLFQSKNYTIKVFSLLGQSIIEQRSIPEVEQIINTYQLSKGMYLVQILDQEKEVFNAKILK